MRSKKSKTLRKEVNRAVEKACVDFAAVVRRMPLRARFVLAYRVIVHKGIGQWELRSRKEAGE